VGAAAKVGGARVDELDAVVAVGRDLVEELVHPKGVAAARGRCARLA
jgi:hypothetical protein